MSLKENNTAYSLLLWLLMPSPRCMVKNSSNKDKKKNTIHTHKHSVISYFSTFVSDLFVFLSTSYLAYNRFLWSLLNWRRKMDWNKGGEEWIVWGPFDTAVANIMHLNYAVPFYIKENCVFQHLELFCFVIHKWIIFIFLAF